MPKLDNTNEMEYMGHAQAVFRVESSSRPGIWHYVLVLSGNRGLRCSCEAAQFGNACKHQSRVPLCGELPSGAPGCTKLPGHDFMHGYSPGAYTDV